MSDLVERLRELDADAATHNAAATLLALTDLLPEVIAALDAQPVGLDVERLARAICNANINHYRGWDAPESHATIDQEHVDEAEKVIAEYAALASEPQP